MNCCYAATSNFFSKNVSNVYVYILIVYNIILYFYTPNLMQTSNYMETRYNGVLGVQ